VTFEMEIHRWTRWSAETVREKIWTEKMIEAFQKDFDWNLLRQEIASR